MIELLLADMTVFIGPRVIIKINPQKQNSPQGGAGAG
jgi:hypothetical protein